MFADCNKPKKYDKKSYEKRRSKDENKSFKNKRDQKVLVAEDIKSKCADPDSDPSCSETSSNENDEENFKCLIAEVELYTTEVELETADDMLYDFKSG